MRGTRLNAGRLTAEQSNGPLNGWGRLLGLVGVPGVISLYLVWWLTRGWAPRGGGGERGARLAAARGAPDRCRASRSSAPRRRRAVQRLPRSRAARARGPRRSPASSPCRARACLSVCPPVVLAHADERCGRVGRGADLRSALATVASTGPFTNRIAETASHALAGEPIMALDKRGVSSSEGPAQARAPEVGRSSRPRPARG